MSVEEQAKVRLELFEPEHMDGILLLSEREGWETLHAERDRTLRALSAPGVVTLVAFVESEMAGFAQTLTDGAVQAYLCRLLVAEPLRGRGIGRLLVNESFRRSQALRMDLLAAEGTDGFYCSFPHHGPWHGYRIDGVSPSCA